MADQACSRTARLLYRQLDAEVVTLFAVVENGDRPRQLCPFGIVRGVVVESIVGELLHRSSQSSWGCAPIDRSRRERWLSGPSTEEHT
jgi:hypothetical protein